MLKVEATAGSRQRGRASDGSSAEAAWSLTLHTGVDVVPVLQVTATSTCHSNFLSKSSFTAKQGKGHLKGAGIFYLPSWWVGLSGWFYCFFVSSFKMFFNDIQYYVSGVHDSG